MKYEVRFLWNQRGRAAVDHVIRCVLPEGVGPHTVRAGFWVSDHDSHRTWFATYLGATTLTSGADAFWVPPGRITGIVPLPTGEPELP